MTPFAEEPRDDEQARGHIRRLAALAERIETGGEEERMVWHAWGAGDPLLLLHGGSGSWTHWVRNIPYFMGHRRVLAADLPGLGNSPDPPEPVSAQSLAEIIASGVCDLLPSGEPADLVGFSFGGILAGHMAAMEGLRLRRLVIVGSPPFGLGSTGPANQVSAVDPALSLEQAEAAHRRNLELLMFADRRSVSPLSLRIHHDNLRRARLRSRKIARTDAMAAALQRSRCPHHGIWGSDDVTVHPDLDAIRELFLERGGDASFDVLPGVGHWAPYEAPDLFNEVLQRRLEAPTWARRSRTI